MKKAGLVYIAVCLAAGSAQAKYTSIKPGLWEVITETRMQGMPAEIPGVVYKTQQCLTQAQLDNQQNLVAVSGVQGNCTIRDVKVTKEWTSWGMSCKKGRMVVDATGMITPTSSTSYKGDVEFSMQSVQAGGMVLFGKTEVKGHRIGTCENSSSSMQPVFKR